MENDSDKCLVCNKNEKEDITHIFTLCEKCGQLCSKAADPIITSIIQTQRRKYMKDKQTTIPSSPTFR